MAIFEDVAVEPCAAHLGPVLPLLVNLTRVGWDTNRFRAVRVRGPIVTELCGTSEELSVLSCEVVIGPAVKVSAQTSQFSRPSGVHSHGDTHGIVTLEFNTNAKFGRVDDYEETSVRDGWWWHLACRIATL